MAIRLPLPTAGPPGLPWSADPAVHATASHAALAVEHRWAADADRLALTVTVINPGPEAVDGWLALAPDLAWQPGLRIGHPDGPLTQLGSSFANAAGSLPSLRPSPGIDLERLRLGASGRGFVRLRVDPPASAQATVTTADGRRLVIAWHGPATYACDATRDDTTGSVRPGPCFRLALPPGGRTTCALCLHWS